MPCATIGVTPDAAGLPRHLHRHLSIDNADPFGDRARAFLASNVDVLLCVSPLVRLEAIVKPLRESDSQLVADYEEFLAAQHWLACDDGIFDRAGQLRARHGLNTPDALHLATALHYGCDEFWTNDGRLKQAAGGIAVDVLRD